MPLFQPAIFFNYLLSFDYVAAATNTLSISLAALVLGLVVGLLLALGQEARFAPMPSAIRFQGPRLFLS